MTNKKIVILGGGIGGIVTARDLRKHLGNEHRIILVDQHPYHTFQPSYLWVVIGWRTPASITKPFNVLDKYGIEFFLGKVLSIDPDNKKVETDRGSVQYDYLVIALGTTNDQLFTHEPSKEIHSFYSFEHAVELSKVIPTFTSGKIAITMQHREIKYPFAPFDAAFLLSSFFSKRGINDVDISIFIPDNEPIKFAGEDNSRNLKSLLLQHNIGLYTNFILNKIDTQNRSIHFNQIESSKFDLLIDIPTYQPLTSLKKTNLTDEVGWIKVDRHSFKTSVPFIWAIGDNVKIDLENGTQLPKAGVFANNQAEIVAFNIAQEIMGLTQRKTFSGYGFFFIETGNSRAANLHGNFYTNPEPSLSFNDPNVTLHWGKVVIEKYWLWRWL